MRARIRILFQRILFQVSSWGEVTAIAPGHAVVTVQAGTGRATVAVEVREGGRRRQSDLEYDAEHSGNCNDPEINGSNQSTDDIIESEQFVGDEETTPSRPAMHIQKRPQAATSKLRKTGQPLTLL